MRRKQARTWWVDRRTAGLAGAAACFLGLAGCYSLVSNDPWYAQADRAGAAQPREGVWRMEDPSKPCAVDEKKPLKDWPDCTGALVISGSRLTMLGNRDGKLTSESMEFLVAAGDPPVVQLHDPTAKTKAYAYAWLRATKLDAQKRAIGIRAWGVACSPPAAKSAGEASNAADATNAAGATNAASGPADYPGLSDEGDGDCVADSRASVQRAAASSERDYPNDVFTAHWVRAGDR